MKVSVIVPVYDVEQYLGRCIDSVLNQTYDNLEVILVDDGSPDKSGEICQKYAAQDPRIKVIHKQNGGLSDARNVGLDMSSGEFTLFIDSDDYIHPRTLELLLADLLENNADIAIPAMQKVYHDEPIDYSAVVIRRAAALPTEDALEKMLYQQQVSNSACKLYRSQLLLDTRYPKGKLCEDLGTTYKIFAKARRVTLNPTPLYYYYQRNGSIVNSDFKTARMDGLMFAKEQLEYIQKNFPALVRSAQNRLFMESVFIIQTMPLDAKAVFNDEWNQCTKVVCEYRWNVLSDWRSRWQHRVYAGLSYISPKLIHLPIYAHKITRRWSV